MLNFGGGIYLSSVSLSPQTMARLQICPLYIFGNKATGMVPMDLNVGFQGLALIQGQIYNPA